MSKKKNRSSRNKKHLSYEESRNRKHKYWKNLSLDSPDMQRIVGETFDPHNPSRPVIIKPRSKKQAEYVDSLRNPSTNITFGIGPAGTGKTYIATLCAIKALKEHIIDQIVITRPAVSVDEQHGFLPGTLQSKLEPWLLPITDVFDLYYTQKEINTMMKDGTINIAPLAFMRGRTFSNSIIIGDEMQNCTPNQMKMLLTRIGEDSKLYITGDLNQHDRGFDKNGLYDFIARLDKSPSEHIDVIKFNHGDIVRHPIIEHILDLYK